MTARPETKAPPKPGKRSAARLAAVQALYQRAMTGRPPVGPLVEEFVEHRLGQTVDDDQYAPADADYFADIVKGVDSFGDELDPAISANLAEGWSLPRLDRLVLAILRAGAYELKARPDVPTAVVINEYVDVAHAFYDGGEPAFVNKLLDKLAAQFRA